MINSEINKDISDFVSALSLKYGKLPKFSHSSSSPDKVYYSGPYFDESELVAGINAFLFGRWSSSGEFCSKFEKEFSEKINQKHSFFCNSGSSANLLMVAACKEFFGWRDQDEIIVSAVGFPTTISAIVQNNLKPVFVDIEFQTLNFDVSLIECKITDRTKAIFLSPVLGNPPNMDFIVDICDKNGIALLLDNCDSLCSKWNGKYLNEYSVASSCSFYPAHEITTLEGGMVSSNNKQIVDIARSYATWGRDCWCVGACNLSPNGSCGKRFSNWIDDFPDMVIDHKYVFNRIGYNLKPLDLCGAIGVAQLKKLEEICEKRKSNRNRISELFLSSIKGLKVPYVYDKTDWVPFGTPIICSNTHQKKNLVNYLEKNGIQTRNYFAGNILIHKGYRHLDDYLKYQESNKVLDLVFFVGCAPTISNENIEYIETILTKYA